MGRIAGRFARVEPRLRAGRLVCGLLSDPPRKNCRTVAEWVPVTLDVSEKRTRDSIRRGTRNLVAALHAAIGEVLGECTPNRSAVAFLALFTWTATADGVLAQSRLIETKRKKLAKSTRKQSK